MNRPPDAGSTVAVARLGGRWWSAAIVCLMVAACSTVDVGNSEFVDGSETASMGQSDGPSLDTVVQEWGHGRTMAPAGGFIDVAVSELMSCGVRLGGELECWGQVETEPPRGEYSQVELSDGSTGYALARDGAIVGWGVGASAPQGVFVDIASGGSNWCALDAGGALVCWGAGFDGHEALAGSGFVSAHIGDRAASDPAVCALTHEGSVRCWGVGSPSPAVVARAGPFRSISAAPYRAGAAASVARGHHLLRSAAIGDDTPDLLVGDICGVRSRGQVECWSLSERPTMGGPAGEFTEVAVGARHACALAAGGAVRCWGANEKGQRGPVRKLSFEWLTGDSACVRDAQGGVHCSRRVTGETVPRSDPSHPYRDVPDDQVDPLSGPFTHVWVMDAGSCALGTDGLLVCWGDPGAGFNPDMGPFTQMVAGRLHGCGLRHTGTVACWHLLEGSLLSAESAVLDTDVRALRDYYADSWAAQDDAPDGTFVQLTAGELHTCALDGEGEISCWGNLEGHGQIPEGPFAHISAAGASTCARSENGRSVCWGRTGDVAISPLEPFGKPMAIVAATVYAEQPCAVSSAGALACAGATPEGAAPWWVGGLIDVEVLGPVNCGIRALDHSAVCWDAATGSAFAALGGNFVQFEYRHSRLGAIGDLCALGQDGTIWCEHRALGYASEGHPVEGLPTGRFSKLAISRGHGCALRVDRAIECWGADYDLVIAE